MRIPVLAVALATTMCLSLPSYAANLQSVTGKVFINSGAGYQPAGSGSEARVGDVVMASPSAHAQLVYPDKCTVEVNPGAVITVQAESPCAGAHAQVVDNSAAYWIGGAAVTAAIVGAYFYPRPKDETHVTNVTQVVPASP